MEIEKKIAKHRQEVEDSVACDTALAADPVDVAVLQRLAETVYDDWCGNSMGECWCSHCRARRYLATLDRKEDGGD